MKKKTVGMLFWSLMAILTVVFPASAQVLPSVTVDQAPVIDGSGLDPVWEKAKALTVQDKVLDKGIQLKSVHTADSVYFWLCPN